MQLVERHFIRKSKAKMDRWLEIDRAAFASKNIYNAANYLVRQAFIAGHDYLDYQTIEKKFKQKDLLPDQQLPMNVVQQVLRQVDQAWRNYFAALKEWKQTPDKFTGKPRLPRYKTKETGRNELVYTQKSISKMALKKRGTLKLTGLNIEIPTKIKRDQLNQVRIVPKIDCYVIEVVYTQDETQVEQQVDKHQVLAIDIGVDTLAALTSNHADFVPLLVNGRPLKSINQSYNRQLARLQAQLPLNQYRSRQMDAITFKRNRRVENYLHHASRRIIDLMVDWKFGTLVIGKNVGWKQGVQLGKVNNQKFVQIPHARFINMLTYKAKLVGIEVVVTEESYTSKCSFLDNEPIHKHEVYAGKRVHRGLFRSATGKLINADVNGSYNIMRKVIPNAFADGIGAAWESPVRVQPRTKSFYRP